MHKIKDFKVDIKIKYVYTVYIVHIQYILFRKEGALILNIIISNSSGEPIYEQIANQIKNQIIAGDIEEGYALPSIRNLAGELKISVITTKRAYEELEKEGYIYTMQGKGSFVSEQNKELIREKRMKAIEEKLQEVIEESSYLNLSIEDIKEMLDVLYDEYEKQ